MKILGSYQNVPDELKGCVLAIGNFDGVHLGHKAVLDKALAWAKGNNAPAGVMFFKPHPRQFFAPDTPLFMLTSSEQKNAIFKDLGMDFAVELQFNAALSGLTAEDFVRQILCDGFEVRHVVIGYDFFFGRARGGNPTVMQELGKLQGFGVTVAKPEGEGGLIYSSSGVRDALEEGQVRRAAQILGRNWSVDGHVKHGAGRGVGLGFPTANIDLLPGCHLLHGIYAVFVHIDGKVHQACAYFGKRPSFDNDAPVLEVFLFDFDDDLYGTDMEVEFVDFIRGDEKFSDLEQLKNMMANDCEQAKEILAAEI